MSSASTSAARRSKAGRWRNEQDFVVRCATKKAACVGSLHGEGFPFENTTTNKRHPHLSLVSSCIFPSTMGGGAVSRASLHIITHRISSPSPLDYFPPCLSFLSPLIVCPNSFATFLRFPRLILPIPDQATTIQSRLGIEPGAAQNLLMASARHKLY